MLYFTALRKRNSQTLITLVLTVFAVITLSSCDLAKNYSKQDRAANMEFQDFRDGLAERLPEPEVDEENTNHDFASVPELQPYIAGNPESFETVPLVSVSVNQTVPLRDVLFELAKQADYDIELDPNITGSIIFTAKNKPFDLVVERISKLAGLRYKFEDNFLRVERDTPFIKTYRIDYLNFSRSNEGAVSSNVSVVSGEGADTGSNFSATSSSSSDLWAELESNIAQILGGPSSSGLRTNTNPRITPAEPNPVDPDAENSGEGETGGAPEVVLNVESLPVEGEAPADAPAETTPATYSINRQAGLINVFATESLHGQIAEYLEKLRKAISTQVLVEAKVFEVALNDEYINGIDWQVLFDGGLNGGLTFRDATAAVIDSLDDPSGTVATTNNFGIGYLRGDVQGFVQAVSGFGTVRALASPRLTVLNNQSAVLNVATNRVFFEIDLERETDEDTNQTTLEIDSEIRSVPEGVLINVQPSIDVESQTISMFVRPTVTRITGTVIDPGVELIAGGGGIESAIPEVNVQEIDTVIRVNSGQPIVMGGLLQDNITTTREGVPVLGEMPLLGNMFRRQEDLVKKTELIIFLKATILDSPHKSIDDTDRDLYRTFSGDRRPLKL
ncbi:MAG: type II and III secretion system family protein [Alphaproteobacteria bacterium]|nr:type II and III secretion system family protein [Alphaproteobacteria bacterium]